MAAGVMLVKGGIPRHVTALDGKALELGEVLEDAHVAMHLCVPLLRVWVFW